MDAFQTLDTLAQAGAVVTVAGGNIEVMPRAVLTDELRAAIRNNKPQITALVPMREHAEHQRRGVFIEPDARLIELWKTAEAATGQRVSAAGKPLTGNGGNY